MRWLVEPPDGIEMRAIDDFGRQFK